MANTAGYNKTVSLAGCNLCNVAMRQAKSQKLRAVPLKSRGPRGAIFKLGSRNPCSAHPSASWLAEI